MSAAMKRSQRFYLTKKIDKWTVQQVEAEMRAPEYPSEQFLTRAMRWSPEEGVEVYDATLKLLDEHGIAPGQVACPPKYHDETRNARKQIERSMLSSTGISHLFRRKHLCETKQRWFRDSMLAAGSSSHTFCQLIILSTWITRWRELNEAGLINGEAAAPSVGDRSLEAIQAVETPISGNVGVPSGPILTPDPHNRGSMTQALQMPHSQQSSTERPQQQSRSNAAELSECVIKIGRVSQEDHVITIDTTMVAVASVFNLYNWEARLGKFTAAVGRPHHKLFWFDRDVAKEIRTPSELECAVKLLYQRMDISVDTQIVSFFTAERAYQIMWLPQEYRNLAAYRQEIIEYDVGIMVKSEHA